MPTTTWSIASSGALSGRSASRRKAIRHRSGRCSAAASGYAGIGVRRSRNDDERDFEDVEVTGVRGGDGQQTFGFLLLRSEEHTSELQSLMRISYAVFCLKKKKK